MSSIHKFVEVQSLIMSVPTILGAIAVVFLWGRPTIFQRATTRDWIMLGVTISFVGQIGDNVYWGVAWTANFLDSPWASSLFQAGVFSNIPFRQGCGTVAAYCHLRAYCDITKNPRESVRALHEYALTSVLLGVLAALLLLHAR